MASNPKPKAQRVRCVINGKEIEVWEGYRLWDAALDADARLWKWCGGQGQCATCAVIPISGAENLSAPSGLERFSLRLWFAKPLALVRKRWKGRTVRLACQSYVRGPVEVVGVLGSAGRAARRQHGLEE
jgi:ferredoxin